MNKWDGIAWNCVCRRVTTLRSFLLLTLPQLYDRQEGNEFSVPTISSGRIMLGLGSVAMIMIPSCHIAFPNMYQRETDRN